jgi:hypothetical protein
MESQPAGEVVNRQPNGFRQRREAKHFAETPFLFPSTSYLLHLPLSDFLPPFGRILVIGMKPFLGNADQTVTGLRTVTRGR